MKNIILITGFAFVSFISYGQTYPSITQHEAEKILGRPAHLSADSTETRDHIVKYRCTYTANDMEIDKDKQSNLYYMLEEYANRSDAEKSFKFLMSQNAGMQGLYPLKSVGDEAFIHTDNDHFQLIIARKSEKIIRMKVNKVTKTTSIEELKRVTKKLTDQL
ncbi:MAG TPA: hypothetical protein VGO21_02340 [Candidatus Paceibacterota bacterium]|nr:hypothetical protein [Candidatus Paceibacterota bacterium]